jgi:hypothetical protein
MGRPAWPSESRRMVLLFPLRPVPITILALAAALGAAHCGEPQPTRAGRPAEARFAERVSEPDLRRYVRELVEIGPRMGGTPSGDRAARYLDAFFREAGLDSRLHEDPPRLVHWEESWAVEIVGGRADGPGAAPDDGVRIESAWPYGYSPAVRPARTAPLIVVEDVAATAPSAEWAGKIVYTPGHVLGAYEAIAGSGHLPAAILTSHPHDPPRYRDWSRIFELPARPDHPVPVFAVSYNDGRRLQAAAAAQASVRVSLAATIEEGRPKTVVATLPGADPDRYYLICAHGDSDAGGPGADDNASGVAVVMEMARLFSELVAADRLPRPAVSLRFAVWGTEYHSSRAYIEREGEALQGLLGVLNFDQIGTGEERETIYFESNDVPWNESLLRTLERVGEDYLPEYWPEFTTTPSQGGTDSYAFLPKEHKGQGYTDLKIPATTIYSAAWDQTAVLDQTPGWESKGYPTPETIEIDYSAYYHSSADTPENTTERQPQNMVRGVRAAGIALLRLAFPPSTSASGTSPAGPLRR